MLNHLSQKIRPNQNIFQLLLSVYGFQKVKIFFICKELGLSPYTPITKITDSQFKELSYIIDKTFNRTVTDFSVGLDFFQYKQNQVVQLKQSGSYKAYRLKNGLPSRGQNTHSNGRTARKLNKLNTIILCFLIFIFVFQKIMFIF